MNTNPLTMNEINMRAPAVFSRLPDKCTSHLYHFQPTDEFLPKFEALGYKVFDATQTGKRANGKHMLTFRRPSDTNSEYMPQIILINAHDGTSSLMVLFGIFRMICSNGLVVGQSYFKPIRIRHLDANSTALTNAIQQFEASIPKVIAMIERMKNTQLTYEKMLELATKAMYARWLSLNNTPKDLQPMHLLIPRRQADEKTDLWTVYNRIQENTVRNGIPHVRTIKDINKTLKLNQKLWDNAVEVSLAA